MQLLSLDQELVVNSSRGHVVIQYVRHHRKGSIGRRSGDQHEPFAGCNHFDMMDVHSCSNICVSLFLIGYQTTLVLALPSLGRPPQ